MRRVLYIILGLVLLACLSPLLSVVWAGWFADRHGCTLHEGFINPCLVNGEDWGETLYTAFVLGWLMLATLPIGALALVGLLILGVVDLLRWRRRRRAG